MRKKRRNRLRKRKNINLASFVIPLVLLFCMDNVLMSLSDFVNDWVYGHLESRTVKVSIGDSSQEEALNTFMQGKEALASCTKYVTLQILPEGEALAPEYTLAMTCDAEAIEPYMVSGRAENLKAGEAVIAKYYMAFNEKDEYYDGEALLGSTIRCQVRSEEEITNDWVEYELTVVGVYDNVSAGLSGGFLMNSEEMDVLAARSSGKVSDEDASYTGDSGEASDVDASYAGDSGEASDEDASYAGNRGEASDTDASYAGNSGESDDLGVNVYLEYDEESDSVIQKSLQYYIVVKDYEDVEAIMSGLTDLGLSNWQTKTVDPKLQYFIAGAALAANFLALTLLFNAAIDIIYMEENDIRTRRHEFGLLKAMGYRDGKINRMIFREMAANTAAALGITAVVGAATLITCGAAAEHGLSIYYAASLHFLPHGSVTIMTLAVGIGAPLAGYFVGTESLRRMEVVGALKDVRD